MSGEQINNYNQSDTNILELQLTSDQSFKGKHLVSLTNYDNTSLPAIAAGSVIEVNGALYKFASEEAITGSPSDGTVYIYIDPSTITAVFTNTSPTWSDSKQGWYGTAGTVNCRYLEFIMTKATAAYSDKNRFLFDNRLYMKEGKINPEILLNNNVHASTTNGAIYTALSPYLPDVNNAIKLVGSIYYSSTGFVVTSRAYRSSSTEIVIQYVKNDGTLGIFTLTSAGVATFVASISW